MEIQTFEDGGQRRSFYVGPKEVYFRNLLGNTAKWIGGLTLVIGLPLALVSMGARWPAISHEEESALAKSFHSFKSSQVQDRDGTTYRITTEKSFFGSRIVYAQNQQTNTCYNLEAYGCYKLSDELERRLEEAKPVYHLKQTYVLDRSW